MNYRSSVGNWFLGVSLICSESKFILSGTITSSTAVEFGNFITGAKLLNAKEIEIRINSPGGEIYPAFEMIESMAGLKSTCTVDKIAASSAFLFFQACTVRQASPYARLMSHHPYIEFSEKTTMTMEEAMAMAVDLSTMAIRMDTLIASRLKMPLVVYVKFVENGKAWFFTGAQGIAFNAVDELVAGRP